MSPSDWVQCTGCIGPKSSPFFFKKNFYVKWRERERERERELISQFYNNKIIKWDTLLISKM